MIIHSHQLAVGVQIIWQNLGVWEHVSAASSQIKVKYLGGLAVVNLSGSLEELVK